MHMWKKSSYLTHELYMIQGTNMLISVDCSHSWEDHNSLLVQWIRRQLYTLKIHKHVQKAPSLDPILSHEYSHLCLFLPYILSLQVYRIKLRLVCSSHVSRLICSLRVIFSNCILLLSFIAPSVFHLQGCTEICSPSLWLSSKRTSFLRRAAGKTQNMDRG
jgi:hypothetical protein